MSDRTNLKARRCAIRGSGQPVDQWTLVNGPSNPRQGAEDPDLDACATSHLKSCSTVRARQAAGEKNGP